MVVQNHLGAPNNTPVVYLVRIDPSQGSETGSIPVGSATHYGRLKGIGIPLSFKTKGFWVRVPGLLPLDKVHQACIMIQKVGQPPRLVDMRKQVDTHHLT